MQPWQVQETGQETLVKYQAWLWTKGVSLPLTEYFWFAADIERYKVGGSAGGAAFVTQAVEDLDFAIPGMSFDQLPVAMQDRLMQTE